MKRLTTVPMLPTARRWLFRFAVVGSLAACGAGAGTGAPAPGVDPPGAADQPGQGTAAATGWFVDRAEEAGLDFVHFNGMTGRFYSPEMMGPGLGLFDYDNDGDLDVYLVQGVLLGDGTPLIGPADGQSPGDRLYRNDLVVGPDGARTLRFTDVTREAGIVSHGYGMGVAAGDYDNDGHVDLYLTRFGPNQMLRNRGDGTFADVSAETGTDDPAWGVPAAFFDYDRDGWLDLFVGNYLNYTLATHTQCYDRAGAPDYCVPGTSRPHPDILYRNRGDGSFENATAGGGLVREYGPALGAVTTDVDGDGWLDLFVANDQEPNQLWVNQRDGTFRNMALPWGAALGAGGNAKADMGVGAGDFDNDGDEDLFITELAGQGSTLYVNDGTGLFRERSAALGIRAPSLPYTGFGAGWIDIDNDGWLDIMAFNGSVVLNFETRGENPFPLDQRNQVFRNLAGERFEDATARAGGVFELSEVSRGAGFGDVDNDGDTDVVVANAAGPVRLLINEIGHRTHWLGLRLVGGNPPRDLSGVWVTVVRQDGSTLRRRARADGSFASANDPRVLFGLGASPGISRVRVTWPSGHTEEWDDLETGRYTTLTEGGGHSR